MRDRWVSVYVLFVLLQLPLYYYLGKSPLAFEFAVKEAEGKLRTVLRTKEEQAEVEDALLLADRELESLPPSSRSARLALNRGVLAWKKGDSTVAFSHLERSRELFDEFHGSDSFHSAAVDLRLGELEFLHGRFGDAQLRFARSRQRVEEYMGARTPFPVRMAFREVSSLVALGREEEAASIAMEFLPDLRRVAPEQDEQFLRRTGQALDMLTLKSLIPSPPKANVTWKTTLTEDRNIDKL